MADTPDPEGAAPGHKENAAKGAESERPATTWAVPVITAVILALAFCAYYFVYVGARRQYLANRNFRALALLGEQLQQRISVHSNILAFCARLAVKPDAGHRQKEDLKRFLLVHKEDQKLPDDEKLGESLKDYLKYLSPSFELGEAHGQGATGLHVERRNDQWMLTLNSVLTYEGSLRIDELMQPLVESVPFDDILLVSNNGSVVYQSNKAGPQFTTLSALLQSQVAGPEKAADKGASQGEGGKGQADAGAKPGAGKGGAPIQANSDPAWRSRSLHLTDVVLAGTPYKLFLQPVLVSAFAGPDTESEPASEWVLCGLRSSTALDWEALSLSYTFFIWCSFAFFIIWANYKVLKIFLMNRRERLRLRELGALGLSLLLLTTVVTLSLLQVDYRLTDDTDARLDELGRTFSRNIHYELHQMHQQLVEWCASPELQSDLRTVMAQNKEVIRHIPPDTFAPTPLSGKAVERTPEPLQYPYTNNGFWTDDDGHQIVKWSTIQYVTPMIDISQLSINDRPMAHLDGDSGAFQFASIMPPNKVEYLATFGMKLRDCAGTSLDPSLREDITRGGAFLTVQPLTLIDPILPYGFGFALVDEAGNVLFDSDKTRNGRENFRLETDDNRELHAAMFSHASQRPLALKYRGTDYRALVVPVPDVSQAPWSLIVYRDLTTVRTLNLQAMAVASTLLFLIMIVPAIVAAVWVAALRLRFAPEWLWPNRRRIETYAYQMFLYTVLTVASLVVGFAGTSESAVVSSAASVYTALLLTWWAYRVFPSPGEKPLARKARGLVALPAALAGLGALTLFAMIVADWRHLYPAGLVLAAGVLAVFPLLERPRRSLIAAFHRRRPADAADHSLGRRGERGFLNFRRCYVASVLLLLALAGVAAPMALFRASLNVERRLAIKQAQRHLAGAIANRWASLVAQHENSQLGEAAWKDLQEQHGRDRNRHPWRWIVPLDLVTANRELRLEQHSAGQGELHSAWFRRLLYSLHHDYNETSAEMLGAIPDTGNTADWTWDDTPSKVTLRWHGAHPAAQDTSDPLVAHDDLLIASNLPNLFARDAVTCAGVMIAVMLLVGGLLRVLARKVFLFHVAPLKITGTRLVAESIREGKNIAVLLPPVSHWELDEPKWRLDIAALANAPRWAEALDLAAVPNRAIVEILHFEFATNDPEIDSQKFVLIDRLKARRDTQLAVIMRVAVSAEDYRRTFPGLEVIDLREEPFPWLEQYQGPARDMIWKECCPMPALWPLGAQLARDMRAENVHSRETIASEILERADPYYRLVWNECTKEQKFVLNQLAEDGVLNPTNDRAIRQLVRRGLIAKDPQFRLVNESFRRFVRSATTGDLKREWLRDSRRSGWGKAHGAFFTSMTLLGLFLLTTQNALWQSAAAYVTTALGALGTMAKLFDAVGKRGATGGGEKPS